jgi:regulator of sigma E protease
MGQAVFILLVAAIVFSLYRLFGLEGVWNISKAAIGLGLMIFIHELGHFLVAKWCDVQVETFSIGFGPAIPGCSFRWGETVYKLAMIPLGGYVKMIGEGDGEEHDDNPRSFKNKPVGQRMMIISAGVTMNILLAFVCFIGAYMMGVKIPVAAVAAKEPGSPAWINPKVRSGEYIARIGGQEHPNWEDLKFTVMLSREGQELPLYLQGPDGKTVQTRIEAVRGPYDSGPKVGITPLPALKLIPERDAKRVGMKPVSGAAADARVVSLKSNAQIVGITDPDHPDVIKELDPKLPKYHDPFCYVTPTIELARAMHAHRDVAYKLRVKEGDSERIVDVPVSGFEYGDRIVGMTTFVENPPVYEPFNTSSVRKVVDGQNFSYFDFTERMQKLAGEAVVVEVERGKSDEPVSLLVPPAYYATLPLRMKMGKVVAVREESPAAQAGVQTDDVIQEIRLEPSGKEPFDWEAGDKFRDPVRLPFELRSHAAGPDSATVEITVKRKGQNTTLKKVNWDYKWTDQQEYPIAPSSPMAISELGIAYGVGPEIKDLDSAADAAGLEEDDTVYGIRYRTHSNGDEGELKWSSWMWFGDSESSAKDDPQPWWPFVFTQLLQLEDPKELQMHVVRSGDSSDYDFTAEPDYSWPMDDRGFRFELATELQQADSPLQAIAMGMKRTYRSIVNTYKSFVSMVPWNGKARLPVTKNLRGPVSIAQMAYEVAGVDLATFLLFLGAINISLAVVNFLPIPILDGGHMVFLIYEKIRGKPASDQVRIGLTYAGLAFLLALMGFVLYLDIGRVLKK